MHVRPHGFADGVSLRGYRPGRVYEMEPVLAEYLVLQGFGEFEMRRNQRSVRVRANERRKATGTDLYDVMR